MLNTVLKLFEGTNYFAYEPLNLELDAREMRRFFPVQYVFTRIVLSEEVLFRRVFHRKVV